ncbi:MAG: hypothetical protein CVV59_01505 [Tenericutes bacterium HGW-Tenericutes-4]|nr:MAG: hypothetical protein CVV59_01505 [Tenericutes bacterium HGW-Tenericutes-4]
MIEIKGLNLAFTKEYYALYNINLEIQNGERVCLLGDSESGKTTLLRVLAGLEDYKEGQVLINEKPLKQFDFSNDVELGYLSYKPIFFANKTVYENLYYVLKIRHIDEVNTAIKINQALKEYQIESLAHLVVKQLSNYQKILVQLARVHLRNIEIYLIDNIFQDVTADEEAILVKHLLNLQKKEATFIVATSKPNLAKKLSNKIIHLKFGSIEKEE